LLVDFKVQGGNTDKNAVAYCQEKLYNVETTLKKKNLKDRKVLLKQLVLFSTFR